MRRLLVLATLVATATTLSVTTAGAQDDSTEQFCNVNWKISRIFNSIGGGPDGPSEEELAEIDAKLAPLFDQAEQAIPAEIQQQVTDAIAVLRQGIATAFEDPTVEENGAAIDAWAFDNCGYQTVEVTGTEYQFEGIPKNLDAGKTMFKFTNEGAELHELAIGYITTKTPLKKLLANEKRAEKEVRPVSGTFAEQDGTGYAYAALKKGRNVAVCFVPVGTTDPNAEPPEGPPHAAEGMVKEFKVS
jgi:hypothetical protein